MKTFPADYSHCEIPELEESDFVYSVSTCPRIEDANDVGYMGDSLSIAVDVTDGFSMY